MANMSFVKLRPASQDFFLHDEMYRICDAELLEAQAVQATSQKIVKWYEDKFKPGAPNGQTRDSDLSLVDSLIYRLRADVQDGYEWFLKEDDTAIRSAETSLDMRLHNELLSFLGSDSDVDRRLRAHHPEFNTRYAADSAAAWVKRLVFRGKSEDAIFAAEKIEDIRPGLFALRNQTNPYLKLAAAEYNVYLAQALVYFGDVEKAFMHLKDVVAALEQGQSPGILAKSDAGTFIGWRRNLVLGRAHNNLGYAHWVPLDHLEAAINELNSARFYFESSEDLREELANTKDNMGRIFALRRHQTRPSPS